MGQKLRAMPVLWLLVVSFVLAGATAPTATADDEEGLVHIAGWSRGDYWKWDKQPTSSHPAQTQGEIVYRVKSAERVTQELWDPEKHRAEWKTHQVWRVKVWANQSANTEYGGVVIQSLQDKFYRREDLATAKINAESSWAYADTPALDGGSQRLHEMYPPQIEIQFPFAVDDQWRMRVHQKNQNPDTNSCGNENQPSCNTITNKLHTYTVLGAEKVTLTIDGKQETFDTYKIQIVDELKWDDPDHADQKHYHLIWWSPEACNFVKKEEYNSARERQFLHTLTDYRCKGRDQPDPTYGTYDYQNFSSTRFHGELYRDPWLDELEAAASGNAPGAGGGLQIFNGSPGFGLPFVVFALAALGAWAGRRRD